MNLLHFLNALCFMLMTNLRGARESGSLFAAPTYAFVVIVAVTLPILLWMRRFPWWEARAVPAASVGVTLAGVYWFVERVAG